MPHTGTPHTGSTVSLCPYWVGTGSPCPVLGALDHQVTPYWEALSLSLHPILAALGRPILERHCAPVPCTGSTGLLQLTLGAPPTPHPPALTQHPVVPAGFVSSHKSLDLNDSSDLPGPKRASGHQDVSLHQRPDPMAAPAAHGAGTQTP